MKSYIKDFIPRPAYYQKVVPYIDTDVIKIIVGQRRVGKSYLFFEIINGILKRNPKADILYINKEIADFDPIRTYEDLLLFVKKNKKPQGKCYVFIDEIQEIVEFERGLRSLLAEGGYDLYCTGSNAYLLSGELATLLSGRYIEIKLNPLAYPEFLQFHHLPENEKSFEYFYKYGGLPYLCNITLEDHVIYEYTHSVYNTIVLKDVVARHSLRNVRMLEDLLTFMADNIGTSFSAQSISQYLKSQRIELSTKVILEYIKHLENAYIINRVKRADLKGKKIFEIGEKYYFEDLGIRHALVRYKLTDFARILENLVYQHLIYKGFKVNIGKSGEKEIDFIAERDSERIYIQVSKTIIEEKTIKREYGNLLEIKDNYPKLVISMDEVASASYKGIQHINIRKFLTEWERKVVPYPVYEEKEAENIVSEEAVNYFEKRHLQHIESLQPKRYGE